MNTQGSGTTRRNFLRNGAIGVGAAAATGGLMKVADSAKASTAIHAYANAGDMTQVDGRAMHVWRFSKNGTGVQPSDWYRVIEVTQGDTFTITLTNNHTKTHELKVDGTSITTGPVPPGQTVTSPVFTAPDVGTYIFHDPTDGNGVYRALGLHGMFVVKSTSGIKPYDAYTTPAFQQQYAWNMHAWDSSWASKAKNNQTIDPATFQPDYFTINGISGWLSDGDVDVSPIGIIGRITLIRIINTTLTVHSPHIHGNHMTILTDHNGASRNIGMRMAQPVVLQPEKDIVPLRPMDIKDCRLPYNNPPDTATGALDVGTYPMHCHTELSQVAHGGIYPNGMLTKWKIVREDPITHKPDKHINL
jgi:hypothetical protein